VNDVDDRCYKGYTFRLDSDKWNCTKKEGCRIDFIVHRPDGSQTRLTASQSIYTGITFDIDNLAANVFCTRQETMDNDKTEFLGVIRFSRPK
jgi:hypothetical protein